MNRNFALATILLTALLAPTTGLAADHPARLVGATEQSLGVPLSGVITEVHVAPGDRVEAGEELLRLEQSGLAARVAATRARMEAEELARDEARREQERAQTLFDRTELSEHDLQIAINEGAAAEATYREAVAAHEQARLERAYSRLEAPVAGTVLAVEAHPGMAVSNRDRVRTLVRLRPADGRLAAVARVGGDHAGDLVEGATVPVTRAGTRAEGVIRGLEAVEGGWRVRLALSGDAPEDWRPGQAVTLELPE